MMVVNLLGALSLEGVFRILGDFLIFCVNENHDVALLDRVVDLLRGVLGKAGA